MWEGRGWGMPATTTCLPAHLSQSFSLLNTTPTASYHKNSGWGVYRGEGGVKAHGRKKQWQERQAGRNKWWQAWQKCTH